MTETRQKPAAAQDSARLYARQVYVDRLAALRAAMPSSLLGAFMGALLVANVLREVFALTDILLWLGALVLLTVWRIVAVIADVGLPRGRAQRAARADMERIDLPALRRWERHLFAAQLLAGLAWGLPCAYWMYHAPLAYQMFILVAVIILGTVAIYSYSIHPVVLLLFHVALYLPIIGALIAVGGLLPATMAAGVVTYFVFSLVFAYLISRMQTNSLRLRFENDELVRRLAVERDMAERGSLAKSQFLASASHDLRQPVHALNLYLGVLNEQPLDARSRELVDAMGRATTAMGQLFDGLLNLSRLDAGVIQPKPRALPLAPMIAQLQLEYAPQAAAKGLRLRVHGARAQAARAVRSDPALLERILRNLVDNAVRHTARGGVLIGWRVRGGAVRIEIWDTGVGISEADRGKIFLEFHQVGNPERDRSKGLGLGLAIVQRTADLLGHTLTLRSTPGRGSLFALTVPAADAGAVEPGLGGAEAPDAMLPADAARRPLVCVIDDDIENLNGMCLLFDAWGYRTVGGGSGEAIVHAAVAAQSKPALIVSDFRLRGQETGISASDRLHEEFADDGIPVILVSGDTDPRRIVEASARGWPLLHKPVDAQLLRRAAEQALRQREQAMA